MKASAQRPGVRPSQGDDGHEATSGTAKAATPEAATTEAATAEPARRASSSAPRRPQQERGQRRVDTILDSAAGLIADEGVAAVTMHRVARRSETTTGSMYHFFPDREALLRALASRHVQALRALMGELEREAAKRWQELSTPDAVALFLGPFVGYVDRNPDLLPLARAARTSEWGAGRDAELDALMRRLAEALVSSRDPGASRETITRRAVAILAITDGFVTAMGHVSAPGRDTRLPATLRDDLRAEQRRALVAYLDSHTR